MGLDAYTDQQSRVDIAFVAWATSCSVKCQACGRVYFVTSPGHGDYEEGELERLREQSEAEPDRVIEVPDFGSVSFLHMEGKQLVVGCYCNPTRRFADWVETHAEELVAYLQLYWQAKAEKAAKAARLATSQLDHLATTKAVQALKGGD